MWLMNNICAYCQRLLLTVYISSILTNIPWSTGSYKGSLWEPSYNGEDWMAYLNCTCVWGRKNSNACHTYLNCIWGHTTSDSPKLPVTLWPWQTSTVTVWVFFVVCRVISHTHATPTATPTSAIYGIVTPITSLSTALVGVTTPWFCVTVFVARQHFFTAGKGRVKLP